MPPSKETQSGYTEIAFAALSALTWQLLSWFGRSQHGRVPALVWVLVAVFLAFSYSIAFNGKWQGKAAWRSPRHWLYWPAGIVSGVAGSCAVVRSQAMAKKPPAPHDPRLSWAVIAVTVAPVVEELLIPRGAAYRPALHPRSVAHPVRRERAPEHPVRCPGIWLRSPGPYRGTIAGNHSDGDGLRLATRTPSLECWS
jgi:hypothetical protein